MNYKKCSFLHLIIIIFFILFLFLFQEARGKLKCYFPLKTTWLYVIYHCSGMWLFKKFILCARVASNRQLFLAGVIINIIQIYTVMDPSMYYRYRSPISVSTSIITISSKTNATSIIVNFIIYVVVALFLFGLNAEELHIWFSIIFFSFFLLSCLLLLLSFLHYNFLSP